MFRAVEWLWWFFHDFNSSKETQKYVLAKLKDKYDKGFNVIEVSNYKEEKIGLNWILVKVSEKDDPLRTATVYARNTGLFEDNYHVYFYTDKIKIIFKNMISKSRDTQL